MDTLDERIHSRLVDGSLPCAAAFRIAAQLQIPPREVGAAADSLDIRLSRCQLGLFGYGSKAEGKHRRVIPLNPVLPRLEAAIRAALDGQGKLSCSDAWRIAAELKVGRQTVSNACEGLGLRIVACQLGAF